MLGKLRGLVRYFGVCHRRCRRCCGGRGRRCRRKRARRFSPLVSARLKQQLKIYYNLLSEFLHCIKSEPACFLCSQGPLFNRGPYLAHSYRNILWRSSLTYSWAMCRTYKSSVNISARSERWTSKAWKTLERLSADSRLSLHVISPTHKRTEGRAPVWGSEFTSKDAALQGGVGEIAARLNVKFCDLPGDWWTHFTPILAQSFDGVTFC